jgi:predicted N-acetyltransferase YhbS
MIVRPETRRDVGGIREVNIVAFDGHPYSQQTERLIVGALRKAGALEVSCHPAFLTGM